jgi:hypothetical protein
MKQLEAAKCILLSTFLPKSDELTQLQDELVEGLELKYFPKDKVSSILQI